jgi:hypothetical protein
VLGGGVIFGTGPTTLAAGTRYHAALVNDSSAGQLKISLNGNLELTTGNSFNAPTTGGLALGGNSGAGDLFLGRIDEARIFTFAAGTFTPSMLSYAAIPGPQPTRRSPARAHWVSWPGAAGGRAFRPDPNGS